MILIYYYITLFGKFVAKVYRDLKAMYFHRIRLCKFDRIYRDFIETSIEIGMKTNLIENYSMQSSSYPSGNCFINLRQVSLK